MSSTTTRAILALTTAALIAGCGSDSTTSPAGPSTNTLDLATLLSQMSVGNINAIRDANAGAAGLPGAPTMTAGAAPPAIVPSVCTYSGATGGFTCPPTKAGGITFSLSFFLYDAAGHSLTTADASLVASVRTVTDASGLLTTAAGTSGTATFTDHEDMTLSGLLTATRTLNGTGKSSFDMTVTAPTAFHTVMNQTSTTANVVLPTGGANGANGANWPQSGTITSDIQETSSLNGSPDVTFPIHTVVTFNGTSIVTVTTTSGSFGATCTIDLSGKSAAHCSFS
jgi:hypothetical protein